MLVRQQIEFVVAETGFTSSGFEGQYTHTSDLTGTHTGSISATRQTSQILPSDYQTRYVPVRSCRLANGHGSNFITVLASPTAASDYLLGNSPLPQGSVIVAAESDRADCSTLVGYTLMFKDVPGYNPAAGDWHWQRLDDQRLVLEDGRVQGCISCHAQCNRNDYTCSPP
jgi:hypothetical protein